MALTTPQVNRSRRWLGVLDRTIGAITASGLALLLPVCLPLLLQWRLRELVQA
jgi:hypothetical protein